MNHIIHQIAEDLIGNLLKRVKNLEDIEAFAEGALEDCQAAVRSLAREAVRQLNQGIREGKELRKAEGLVCKEKDRPRSLLTKVGLLEFQRDCYWNRNRQAYEYPADELIGVRAYERVGAGVSAQLVNLAAEMSYAESA